MKQQGKGMVIVRSYRNPHYTTLRLGAIEDPRLSYKAKGLHTYLISRPPKWKFFYHDLLQRATDGKDSITSAMKELKKYDYLRIELLREKGKISGAVWHVFEEPGADYSEQPYPENPDAVNPYPVNPQQSINNTKNNNQKTTTAVGVVDEDKKRSVRTVEEKVQLTSDKDRVLMNIVVGTPFETVDYGPWLKRSDLVDQIDKLVQTYSEDFSKAKRPQALVMSVMRNGAIAPDGYVPYFERQARAKIAAAKTLDEKLRKEMDRASQKARLHKFHQLSEKEKSVLLTEASATLSPILSSSKGLVVAKALELLEEREEFFD